MAWLRCDPSSHHVTQGEVAMKDLAKRPELHAPLMSFCLINEYFSPPTRLPSSTSAPHTNFRYPSGACACTVLGLVHKDRKGEGWIAGWIAGGRGLQRTCRVSLLVRR